MRHAPSVNTIRGHLTWTAPLRLKIAIFPKRQAEQRLSAVNAEPYAFDFDRIFAYMKTHKLPTEAERAARRDARNAVDFLSDVRELQTPPEVWPI